MICPTCNIQMNHLNKWWWFFWTDVYQTYDFVECPDCKKKAIEFYHTEMIWSNTDILPTPKFKLEHNPIN